MKEVIIYTDGACSGNPGPGGWGTVLFYGNHKKEMSGFVPETTNNRMEMQAAIEALKVLKEPCKVKLHSDSAYLVNCFKQGWHKNWVKNGWKNSKKQPVENQDLWKEILSLMEIHDVEFIKVKGHSDNEWNNRCDELATGAIANQQG
jgi:ribonuclease HI